MSGGELRPAALTTRGEEVEEGGLSDLTGGGKGDPKGFGGKRGQVLGGQAAGAGEARSGAKSTSQRVSRIYWIHTVGQALS